MESDYDQKFEDMKKYIPFLESMIKRLESTNAISANPRQAQLDKIRSLRDLLLDKKKRMKMENLIKCEQVLINLYAKVEQRDTLPKRASGSSTFESSKMENNSNLEIVRNKLKRVSKIQDEAGTLPEIVRASDIEDVCTAGSVEPALFQRRPHKKSPTLSDISSSSQEKINTPETSSTRKYTRVLISPERDRVRSTSQESLDTVLFSRRSPRRSSSYTRRDSKKSSNSNKSSGNTKDFNITLKVPEESLNSLNTKDILSRIITCNDNDVDIDTLRGLRTQILSELKQTGANDDISDLILKSYAGKNPKTNKKEEIEEGELSDSESEAIESIYGSLVLVDKDKSKSEEKSVPEKDQPRKIQICLVINSKDNSEPPNKETLTSVQNVNDECDLEMFNEVKEVKKIKSRVSENKKLELKPKTDRKETPNSDVTNIKDIDNVVEVHDSQQAKSKPTEVKNNEDNTSPNLKSVDKVTDKKDINLIDKETINLASPDSPEQDDKKSVASVLFKANFYKPLHEEESNLPLKNTTLNTKDNKSSEPEKQDLSYILNKKDDSVEIPLLNDPVIAEKPVEKDIDSQIDILQALKNEILADNILPVSNLEVVTPPLHQPKISKVASVQGITIKKRISIEKYKEKTTPVSLTTIPNTDVLNSSLRDDNLKKQSLKLTDKECERFNFPTKLNINDDLSSEDEGLKQSNVEHDVYKNFAPKSPDNDDTRLVAKTQPVIIPVDPVKASVVSVSADVDMRTMSVLPKNPPEATSTSSLKNENKKNDTKADKTDDVSGRKSPLIDPRTRKDINQSVMVMAKSLSSSIMYNPKTTPNRTSTSISFDISPNQQKNESDVANTPVLNNLCSPRSSETDNVIRKSRWDTEDSWYNVQANANSQSSRYGDAYKRDKNLEKKTIGEKNDDAGRSVMPLTPLPVFGWPDNSGITNQLNRPEASIPPLMNFGKADSPTMPTLHFGHSECPSTVTQNFRSDIPVTPNHPFGRTDCPMTPSHPFGRSDCPGTPIHPFGRSDCPATPSHPFGRTDCPATPIHPFGRLDCPATPSHPFGRSDIPPTPSHIFGRSDCPATPSHPFGRIDGPPTTNNQFGRIDFPGAQSHPYGMSDCPTTPSHPFGRSDCPPTPSHPFGRLDCPPTPSHSFGMSECPQTPSHPFGRAETLTPNYSFNRGDHSQNISLNKQFSKDPRLNRRSEYDPRYRRDERSHGNYNDRGFTSDSSYHKQSRSYGKPESYMNYDREISDRRQRRPDSRLERSFGREMSRDNEKDQPSYSERGSSYKYVDRSRRRERDSEDRYRRERSGERSQDSCESVQSRSRDRSVGRNSKKEINNDNKLSIKPDAGRSFTIDTSVNSTFQDLLKKKGIEPRDPSFDTRRNRAASVGRTKESYCHKRFADPSIESATANDSEHKNRNFRRASSVGRDLHRYNDDRSYQEIKKDFQNYKSNCKITDSTKDDKKLCDSMDKTLEENPKNKIHSDNQHVTSSSTKQPYSPRRNYRDPRMRRDYEDKKNQYGFTYSSDSIAKGSVLRSGYGVKNYKIPKIKRPNNENQSKDNVSDETLEPVESKPKKSDPKTPTKDTYNKLGSDDSKDASNRSPGRKTLESTESKSKKIEVKSSKDSLNNKGSCDIKDVLGDSSGRKALESVDTKCKKDELKTPKATHSKQSLDDSRDVSDDSPGRRITRSSKKQGTETKSDNSTNDTIKRKYKKIINEFDSESDSSEVQEVEDKNSLSDDDKPIKNKFCDANKNQQSQKESKPKDDTDNEIFFDNVSDPVIDNLNALIDDLDNHINSSGYDTVQDFTKDVTFDCQDNKAAKDVSKKDSFDSFTNKDVDKNVNAQSKYLDEVQNEDIKTERNVTFVETVDLKLSSVRSEFSNGEKTGVETLSQSEKNTNNEVIDSTTGKGNCVDDELSGKNVESVDGNIATSPADSTNEIIQNQPSEHTVPDSTNEVNSEMNSDVSSSLISADVPIKDFAEPGSSGQETVPSFDSIGSLLSILQDKSKIHQLLSMLGEQSGDNDKIKRKLEKLSEIVSDDEEEAPSRTDSKEDNVINKENASEMSKTYDNEEAIKESPECDKVENTEIENTKSTTDCAKNIDISSKDMQQNEQVGVQNDKKSLTTDTSEVVTVKKGKGPKKGKGKITKTNKVQRITRAAVAQADKPPATKKLSRELVKLREDIKEMFLTDEMLNSTGIRMCRLAKFVDETNTNRKEDATQYDPKPVVVIEKFKNQDKSVEPITPAEKYAKKKPFLKTKRKTSVNDEDVQEDSKMDIKSKVNTKNASVSKSKIKVSSKQQELDPYEFEVDSFETSTVKESESEGYSDTDNVSLASSLSFGSSELLVDLQKKTKRKRRGKAWQTGIIKPKNKKKKVAKTPDIALTDDSLGTDSNIAIPDKNCFTDKYYCFQKNVSLYSCRLCVYTGDDIIIHYKQQHPHTEIPLSRMNPNTAKEAIQQCQEVNFPAISKISTDKYVCRFCFKDFSKNKTVLESFFWHIVSMHTGEYKQTCSECDPEPCYFNLDIPPPPKENKGQLIGYLCGKCNFTQVSLENLKTHVIGRHNDEQTDVYTINLSAMTRKTIKTLAKHQNTIATRTLRSTNSNRSISDNVDDSSEHSKISSLNESISLKEEQDASPKRAEKNMATSIQSKIAFEPDENIAVSDRALSDNFIEIKQERFENDIDEPSNTEEHTEPEVPVSNEMEAQSIVEEPQQGMPDDILDYPHFKVSYKDSGVKEYVCCINGIEHYRTSLMISMKKHVQFKHDENWDGFCFVCKVIITPPGKHSFKECLQHFFDRHMDEFPVMEPATEVFHDDPPENISCDVSVEAPKYINVRPIEQLVSGSDHSDTINDSSTTVPIIESVVSLNNFVDVPQTSPNYATVSNMDKQEIKQYKYEEWQEVVTSKKHSVVLNAMMTKEKLIKVYKCTGRFCSFTSDNAEHALVHAMTHQRIGGEGSLSCAYCDFDACNNGIDLVTHVFKAHGNTQYACGLCFYRALASQLVNSHMSRKHPNKQADDYVLHTVTDIKPVTEDSDNILVREVAVPSYVCGQITFEAEGGPCNFRTYTPTQLCDHLQQRHQPPYQCNMCPSETTSASDLVNHMKEHGYRLYQCTFCVFGADNEKEMLDHASVCHPMRLPQAYLRLITNKDGNQQLKVLPRVYLNKCKVKTEDVASDVADDPVREAQRCIELEKLIGHIDTTIQITSVESVAKPVVADTSNAAVIIQVPKSSLIESKGKAVDGTPTTTPMILDEHQDEPAVVKTEPNTDEPSTSKASDAVVYCLDSDEDEPAPRVIDLSDDDPITTQPTETASMQLVVHYKKVPMAELYVCPICRLLCKNIRGFKKHLNTGHSASSAQLKCPHGGCTMAVRTCTHLTDHYIRDHSNVGVMIYVCGVCNAKYKSLGAVKQHMKGLHKTQHFDQNPLSKVVGGTKVLVITPITAAQKASGNRRRYGPQDIDRLPINPILDNLVFCALCEFNTKVRLNMVRHLQLHSQQQSVPQTAPVNPVPHLETNERHFDKMVNLASSSIINRATERPVRTETASPVTLVSAETANRYPKYVPDRQRYTCGAKGCSYISVDETMFRCHWDTLHSNTNDYHCVHCPPHQHLDTSRPLTSARIIGHLKMHDDTLYACTACSYYHHNRIAMEKHLAMEHRGAQLITVRLEGGSAPPPLAPAPAAVPPSSAPTMDLKPWQCGLCKFKSMLRPEVADHCAKVHQSKMQYRCNYCPFRTSTVENVTKHQQKSHPEKKEDVFYYYYREGSIPDEDGTPRWVKQNQKSGNTEPVVKCEVPEPAQPEHPPPALLSATTPATPASVAVDLNLVKQEVVENETVPGVELSMEELCKKFGEFCEPKGMQYKCSLCTVVVEDTIEAMQSHLYEELKYRKWGCGLCSYKAFHKAGLSQHMTSEHRGRYEEPIELQTDVNAEKWVIGQLDYQTSLIEKHQDNLRIADEESRDVEVASRSVEVASRIVDVQSRSAEAQNRSVDVQNQSVDVENQSAEGQIQSAELQSKSAKPKGRSMEMQTASTPSTSKEPEPASEVNPKYLEELEQAFGPIGAPRDGLFCCPRCSCTLKEEKVMKEHLESEMTKIRWACNHCSFRSQIYHEAQFHCRTAHMAGARPVEAVRNVMMRAHWVSTVLRRQKQAMSSPPPEPISPEKTTEATEPQENSLLVVRYEERVPAPENVVNRKRVAPPDSDEEKLVIDESAPSKKQYKDKSCPHCDFTTKWNNALREHILRHYNLKPFKCHFCKFMGHRYVVTRHIQSHHTGKEIRMHNTPIPTDPPIYLSLPKHSERKDWDKCSAVTVVCLHCEKGVREIYVSKHVHGNLTPVFAKVGENVVKCGICFTFHLNLKSIQNHHNATHGDVPLDYAYYKMDCDPREYYYCDHCNNRFSLLSDLKSHHRSTHNNMDLKYSTAYPGVATYDEEWNKKRKKQYGSPEPKPKRFAKKSTTKLPFGNMVAKKSTTKLPFNEEIEGISLLPEYSFYGTKPTPIEEYANITTLMPFCNTMVPFTIKKLSEIIKIEPTVRVKDVRK